VRRGGSAVTVEVRKKDGNYPKREKRVSWAKREGRVKLAEVL